MAISYIYLYYIYTSYTRTYIYIYKHPLWISRSIYVDSFDEYIQATKHQLFRDGGPCCALHSSYSESLFLHAVKQNQLSFFLFGFSFTNITIHKTQQRKGESLYILSTTSNRFRNTQGLVRLLLQRAHLCAQLEVGLKPGTFGFIAQVAKH